MCLWWEGGLRGAEVGGKSLVGGDAGAALQVVRG